MGDAADRGTTALLVDRSTFRKAPILPPGCPRAPDMVFDFCRRPAPTLFFNVWRCKTVALCAEATDHLRNCSETTQFDCNLDTAHTFMGAHFHAPITRGYTLIHVIAGTICDGFTATAHILSMADFESYPEACATHPAPQRPSACSCAPSTDREQPPWPSHRCA